MKKRHKIALGLLLTITVAAFSLGITLSHNAECEQPPALANNTETMNAVVYRCYGSPEVLSFERIQKPLPTDNEVLIKISAASVNPLDWHFMRGSPYFLRLMSGIGSPTEPRLGVDFSGTVEAVGNKVTHFKVGDKVFGGETGAFSEYITVNEKGAIALNSSNMTFEQSASVPIAAITALQALRDNGKLKSGQKVLINGASGGVGTFAVQIAKSFGANVTGVCSTRNLEMVKSLGADQVIDYTKEDYSLSEQQYDLIIDIVGNHSPLENKRVLKSNGIYVGVGGPSGNWLAPLVGPIYALLLSPFVSQEFGPMVGELRSDDLAVLADLMSTGKITPVIDRRYGLEELAAAVQYSEKGHARGKIIINME